MCLEFSEVSLPVLRELYDAWSFHAIPALGHALSNDREVILIHFFFFDLF
jgi:demethylmenaquinone methyltransferase/2-methoxy-6-polyprenyl-1,4-benzoquinol methylase